MSAEITSNFVAAKVSSDWTPQERLSRKIDEHRNDGDRRADGSTIATRQDDSHIVSRLSALADSPICTARERQIVRLVLQGMTSKQIAQQLQIEEDTVKKRLRHVYAKLGVNRRNLVIVGQTSVQRRDNQA